MRHLIISDIHTHHHRAQQIIDAVPHDVVVCLGDFFHDFNDTPDTNLATARWLKQKLADPNFIALWGNHDIVSAFPSHVTYCSGWDLDKQCAIDTVMRHDDWAKFRPCYYIEQGNWLLSHAGVNRHVFEEPALGLTPDVVACRCYDGLVKIAGGDASPCFAAGRSRGGTYNWGGITWQDFSELTPVEEFKQIVGHTPLWPEPQVRFMRNGGAIKQQTHSNFNGWETHPELAVDLDTHGNHYAVLEDGRLEIFSTKDLTCISS